MAKKNYFILLFLLAFTSNHLIAQVQSISSPNGENRVVINLDSEVSFKVFNKDQELIKFSPISMTLDKGFVLGKEAAVIDIEKQFISEKIYPIVRQKSSLIIDECEEITFEFEGDYSLKFRAYNDGVAYRWITDFSNDITVYDEEATFHFTDNFKIYFPEEESFITHQERLYKYLPLSEITPERFCSIPALVDAASGVKVAITESDLDDYPGMYLSGSDDDSNIIKGIFPYYPLKEELKRDRDFIVIQRANYMAKTEGEREFPWRVMVISNEDGELIESQMVYKLAKPTQIGDASWIKPGKVAWDWWNANNVYNVDFEAGVNTDTYKHYIDFASQYGIEYIILDEGWYKLGNLMDLNPDINMEELVKYSEEKGVGLILWVVWKTLDDQLEEAMDKFEDWGIKGIKVDFMQRDDQLIVNYYKRIAIEAADREMLVDFHGSYKPSGLRRAYPNVITREGVVGLEHSKWSKNASPVNNLVIPFIRMLAGPMDYTPGAMINANMKNFNSVFSKPMSLGTRCHQLAMYVVYESPLQMLADSPTHYMKETECMEFLKDVPTVWDDTKVLDAKVGEYVLVARQSGEVWYVGAMTNWTERSLEVDLSFLGDGEYVLDLYQDGENADRNAEDYRKIIRDITKDTTYWIDLASGGGYVAKIYKK